MPAPRKPRVGISACLLGRKVRYDGREKRAGALLAQLGPRVTWVPVCPELELGLGVPRPPIGLAGRAASPRLVVIESGEDLTAAMRRFAARRLSELAALDLDGWITKAGSPSCGLVGVPVRTGGGRARRGTGLFVAALRRGWPDLPIAEERRLVDAAARARFLARVQAHRRRRLGPPPRRRRG